ncbi:MAG: hypothetical protein QNJ84_12005 [Alphaproteobacteria bacterium]|nr:hypothetical protein [Alphaproteobacteria bacterium]
MQTFTATRISIIAERLIQDGVVRIMEEAGATGYSFFEGGGKGGHGFHPTHRPSIVEDFAIVKIEAIVSSRAVAEQIAEQVAAAYFGDQSAVMYLHEVEVLRPEKF